MSRRGLWIASTVAFAAFASLFFVPACQASCATSDDCESDEVCLFSTGKCALKCDPKKSDACSSNQTCDSCASSSCKTCQDCIAACVDRPDVGGGQGGW